MVNTVEVGRNPGDRLDQERFGSWLPFPPRGADRLDTASTGHRIGSMRAVIGEQLGSAFTRVGGGVDAAARADGAYLIPVRIFVGLGWLRAFGEKAADPGWTDGTSLSAFLLGQMESGRIAFPTYEALVGRVFLPNATALGWVVLLGQLLVGIAILCGGLTTAALLGGLFMNANFLLAGVPDPSAFYIVLQAVLLVTGAGAVAGVDAWLGPRIRRRFLVAHDPLDREAREIGRPALAGIGLLGVTIAAYSLAHVTAWSPAGSVHDPAMIMAILAAMGVTWVGLAYLRTGVRTGTV